MAETHETIRYTADLVLFADGHVLLIKRKWDPYAGSWALPGGHRNADEGPDEAPIEAPDVAAAREAQEETGLTAPAADLRHVGRYDAPGRDPRGRYITDAYAATLPSPIPPTAADDAAEARWWPLDALPNLAFDHARILADAQHQLTH
ncbi:NUDIX domain-containing protein [Streptomyces sp. NPDC017529]|uniref:NUDIX domain-containing protein n=1 Tax=Streptomyces sp. NPDC017529 TaxID=3365000 RepID=UPI00379A7984